MPDTESIKFIQTGNVSVNSASKTRSGQLIQDIMGINLNATIKNADIDHIMVSYHTSTVVIDSNGNKKKQKGPEIQVTLRQLLDVMEKQSNANTTIVIDDNAYDALLGMSALNIQAKAGFNQTPWNKAERTSFTIGEFTDEVKRNGVGVKRIFFLLHSLNQEEPHSQWIADSDNNYNAMANYGLTTVLAKILHLSAQEGNQYLLTPMGFTTYTERISYLMEKHHTSIKISSNVQLTNTTLQDKYSAQIPKS